VEKLCEMVGKLLYGTTSGIEQNKKIAVSAIRRRFVPPWFEVLMGTTFRGLASD
jgi:hypothetical protein